MHVTVLCFAALKDEVGPAFSVDVKEPATVASLRRSLEEAHPAFQRFGRRARVAVNEAYATESDPVNPGDTVAILPPVAGG